MSIYELICQQIREDGSLDIHYELPQQNMDRGIKFAPGAMDGIFAYHTENQQESADKVVGLLLEHGKQTPEFLMKLLEAEQKDDNILAIIDSLQQKISDSKDFIDAKTVYGLAIECIMKSEKIPCVKLGLALMELFSIEEQDTLKNVVFRLGLYDEFTLFSLFLFRHLKDSNQYIFELAKKVHGWGKIHAVEMLEAKSDTIRTWLLCHGCENTVFDGYLALVCAEKTDLLEYLKKESLTADELKGAAIIISALLNEGPSTGISGLAHADEVLKLFLKHLNSDSTFDHSDLAEQVNQYLEHSKK